MSLVFTGAHVAFHNQHFKMMDVLINNFNNNMHGLNPCTEPYVPRMEVNKVEIKEEEEIKKYERINKLCEECKFK